MNLLSSDPTLQPLERVRRAGARSLLERRLAALPELDGFHARLDLRSPSLRRGFLAALAGLGSPAAPERTPRRDPLLALVQRITPGFELAEYERARALGYEAYLEEQLDPLAIDDSLLEARLAGFPTLAMSPKELVDAYPTDIGTPLIELKGMAVLRAVHSKRHLFERMCEFWRDHFSIDHNKGDIEWALKPEDERTVILPHALGTFPDMLCASAFSPAMQYYLDNWLNVRGAPQENYARELMELHTLGLHGGYNEVDVKEVAKCFTGWTLNLDFSSPDFLRTQFVAASHTAGQKSVLGNTIPANPGRENAQRVLDLLGAHPSTAHFLAQKLVRWLLTPAPPDALVERVAETYLDTGGDIRAMLRVILARENLGALSGVLAPKFRRPFHFVVSLLRTLEADVRDPLYPIFLLFSMGHGPFERVTPDGYPDTLQAWGSSLLPRWNFASLFLASARPLSGGAPLPGVLVPYERLLAKLELSGPRDRAELARRINDRLLGGALTRAEEESLQAFVDAQAGLLIGPILFETLALAASLPGFQWY